MAPALVERVKAALPPRFRGALAARWRRLTAPVEQHHFAGVPLRVCMSDILARDWYGHDWGDQELPEMALLQRGRLQPGARVFNLGAHHGIVAMVLASIVGEAGEVVAVEAGAFNASILRYNLALNRRQHRVQVVEAVAGSGSTTIPFDANLNGRVCLNPVIAGVSAVRGVSIDQLSQRFGRPDVIYLDVEGYELAVLAGARATLAGPTDWFVEVHAGEGLEAYGGSVAQVLAPFRDADFTMHISTGNGYEQVTVDTPMPTRRFHLIGARRR